MSSFVVHATLPLLFLLAVRRLDVRKVWILWPLTLAPDLDYFVGLHRAATANLFVLVPFVAALVWGLRKERPALVEWMAVALVYLVSHLLMDMMTGGVVPLWPVSDYTVCYVGQIVIETATNTPYLQFEACSHEGLPQVATFYTWLSVTDLAMLAFIVPAGLAMAGWNLWKYRQAATLVKRGPR